MKWMLIMQFLMSDGEVFTTRGPMFDSLAECSAAARGIASTQIVTGRDSAKRDSDHTRPLNAAKDFGVVKRRGTVIDRWQCKEAGNEPS